MTVSNPEGQLPPHVDEVVDATTRMRNEHYERASISQRLIRQVTRALGHPWSIVAAFAIVIAWVSVNAMLFLTSRTAWDAPPFAGLEVCVAVCAMLITMLILATQSHDDALERRREQMILQLSVLSERKSAKIIELLKEIRHDLPHMKDRTDPVADELATSANVSEIYSAIKDADDDP